MNTKKILFFGLIIFASLLFFSSVEKVQAVCGDSIVDGVEECDDYDFNGEVCQNSMDASGNYYTGGNLWCDSSCLIHTDQCTSGNTSVCGDGVINGAETCDGLDLSGQTCQDFMGPTGAYYTGGTLSCDSSCNINTTSCTSTGGTGGGGGGGTGTGTNGSWCMFNTSCQSGCCNWLSCSVATACTGGTGGTGGTGAWVETCGSGSGTCIPTATACSNPITLTGYCNTAGTSCCTNGAYTTTPGGITGPPPPGGTLPPGSQVTGGMVGAVYIPGSEVGLPAPSGGIVEILVNFLAWAIFIFGILAMIGFIVSGIQYVAATGNESVMESAKRNMTYSIVGVIVGLSGYIIVRAIYAVLSGTP